MAYPTFIEGINPSQLASADSNHIVIPSTSVADAVNVNASGRFNGLTIKIQNKHAQQTLNYKKIAAVPTLQTDGNKLLSDCENRLPVATGEAVWVWGSQNFIAEEVQ